ncbi:MAG TPA: 30S ribosomal protein S12 methylthiotransferase RimO [Candidatus Margulisiibacteriota bacterium]|nr:30S ribosomal protein S12 methylthiotransferase RimO [Candidatus Margulisiibacteriota bacterium]
MAKKVYLQSLGCPKNLVDSEMMLGLMARDGAEIVLDPEAADVTIVNTCGFIGEAKKESVDTILELGRLKESDPSKRLIVTGCLVQRYGSELQAALPEVDAFLGTGDFDRLPELLADGGPPNATVYGGAAHLLPHLTIPRVRTGHFFSAYLKISEGCDHTCSFCIIPKIRGRHESRSMESVLAEATALAADGVVELNLIGQDLTAYGRERRDGSSLAALLRALVRIDGLRWIRLLYNYPRYVTDELLDTIASEAKICSYIDMPLQHISDRMLRAMRRERDGAAVRRLVARLRARIPGVALRTSFIVGFPGETDADFAELVVFANETCFDRLGVFRYSKEEGTAAATLPGQLPEHVKRHRYNVLMRAQAEVAIAINRRLVGSVQEVLVCGEDDHGRSYGRLASQAPDIDGVVFLKEQAAPGQIVSVRITGARTYDLEGEIVTGDGRKHEDKIAVDTAGEYL